MARARVALPLAVHRAGQVPRDRSRLSRTSSRISSRAARSRRSAQHIVHSLA